MKESYSEDLASHAGPELYAGDGNIAGVATTGVHAGQVLSSENRNFRVPTLSGLWEGDIMLCVYGERSMDTAESKTLCMYGNSKRENREIPSVSIWPLLRGAQGWNGQKTPQVVPLI
jgi:hypothetical protein